MSSTAATGDQWLAGIGLAVWLAGLALAVWARIYIGRNWGMPMTQQEDPDLVTTGPYRLSGTPSTPGIILGDDRDRARQSACTG